MEESACRVLLGNELSSNKKKRADITKDTRDVQKLGAGKCGKTVRGRPVSFQVCDQRVQVEVVEPIIQNTSTRRFPDERSGVIPQIPLAKEEM